jgi:hypothetical protein
MLVDPKDFNPNDMLSFRSDKKLSHGGGILRRIRTHKQKETVSIPLHNFKIVELGEYFVVLKPTPELSTFIFNLERWCISEAQKNKKVWFDDTRSNHFKDDFKSCHRVDPDHHNVILLHLTDPFSDIGFEKKGWFKGELVLEGLLFSRHRFGLQWSFADVSEIETPNAFTFRDHINELTYHDYDLVAPTVEDIEEIKFDLIKKINDAMTSLQEAYEKIDIRMTKLQEILSKTEVEKLDMETIESIQNDLDLLYED